ncbi:TerB family tellurite resistance protein, partial [Paracoccus sp. (in: a-proteobacteria)]|uniref:tellurite resistance TerB family protein n=1 Tax=Paracoccus sp. TaxID=267 RepID=UPI0028AD5730
MDAAIKDHQQPCPELPKPRSFWQRIADRLAAIVGTDRAATPPEKSVAFTIAVIALGAKLAKADGAVARSEVAAFRRVFIIPRSEEKNAARVFDLARQDVAGFDAWARRIARMFPPGDPVLADVIEGLFIIAVADSELHEAEILFIDKVARIFGMPPAQVAT